MSDSFVQWRDSLRLDSESFVISDSEDDDIVQSSLKQRFLIDESHEDDVDESYNTTPTKSQSSEDTPVGFRKNIKKLLGKKKIVISDDSTSDETESNEDYKTSHDDSDISDEDYIGDKDYDSSVSYSPHQSKGKKRKDVTHDNTREDIKELKPNSSNESFGKIMSLHDHDTYTKNTTKLETLDLTDKVSNNLPTFNLDSDSCSGESGSELAISLAKKEIGVGNVNPIVAQKRAMLTCKLHLLQDKLAAAKLILNDGKIEVLEDKGEKLRESVQKYEQEIKLLKLKLENTPLVQNFDTKKTVAKNEPYYSEEKSMFVKDESSSDQTDYSYFDIDNIPMKPTTSPEVKELGKKAQETRDKELALTVERLKDLHGSLVARPSEDEVADDPKGLKVPLMSHQKHALAWLLWREQQRPSGGVLADDMGLGKTLTMISLIMATLGNEDSMVGNDESDDSDDGWNKKKPLRHAGGTLVVCPASLLSQWEKEVLDKCKQGSLSVQIYHGSNRENVPTRLAKNDIVITTYNIVAREYKSGSTLFKIHWKRAILDEAHIVRNHKNQAAIGVCGLTADKRWALTGTPIQNKEMDLYSILKFLKCTPFDDIRVWKRWVDNKNAAGHERLATVMKTIMLRRTKQELQSQGRLESLPEKYMEEMMVKLDSQEQLVYEKILVYSRTLFAQFLAQRADKEHMFDLHSGKYNKPTFFLNPNKETQFTKAQKKLLAMHADVKTHEILVLLLRLRQVCCHPALVHAMLDQEEMQVSGIMDAEDMNPKFLSRLSNISLHGIDSNENSEEENEDIGIDRRILQNVLTSENPVFDDNRVSSKMKALLDMVEKILQTTNDKVIIVSQWATLLDIIASHLEFIENATFAKFTGKVAIKDRPTIVDSFNKPNSDPRILLLSLTAGGVGLNLVGGNHLLLFDIHWNPQLETQAQDRIYRFGQKKDVYVYKFICSNTIEERIKVLQERKLAIAHNVLSGERNKEIAKLTLNDLKSLFGL
ncbi:transcription termination factor 2 [Odontomachus brunneus]|uniref:transcription termination factor 2 n=1 Tax=Odontomachus brunneus TaxID=486640 RepID=UPI0013F2A13A|nr:transcription termination factor 2 [Odontomachus brunneus]